MRTPALFTLVLLLLSGGTAPARASDPLCAGAGALVCVCDSEKDWAVCIYVQGDLTSMMVLLGPRSGYVQVSVNAVGDDARACVHQQPEAARLFCGEVADNRGDGCQYLIVILPPTGSTGALTCEDTLTCVHTACARAREDPALGTCVEHSATGWTGFQPLACAKVEDDGECVRVLLTTSVVQRDPIVCR